jgi:hypothetical protein
MSGNTMVSTVTQQRNNLMPNDTLNTSNAKLPANNVVNLFTQQTVAPPEQARAIQLHAETSGIRMLYSAPDKPERLVAVPILCWVLREDGNITALLPWLDDIIDCESIEQQYQVSWEGFYNPHNEEIFYAAPDQVAAILQTAARFIAPSNYNSVSAEATIVQEIIDPIGTHALMINDACDAFVLTTVISWTLDSNGALQAMLADHDAIEKFPVLPGDNCLYSAHSDKNFKCFFQRDIAEQIREQNPETLQAIEKLFAAE